MKLTIQPLNFNPGRNLNEYITENVGKLSRFYDRIESANVCLKLENADLTEAKVCEIKLTVPGNNLFAKKQSKTFEEAISETVDALKQQLEKMKKKNENQS